MQQLTKPEILNGEQVVNVQLTNQDIKYIHEALVSYLRDENKRNPQESSVIGIAELRDEFKEVHKKMNPS